MDSDSVDRLIVSMTARISGVLSDDLPVSEFVGRVRIGVDGSFGLVHSQSVEEANADLRQQRLEAILSSLYEAVRNDLLILRRQATDFESSLALYISLCPVSGQAGFLLTPDVLAMLAEAKIELYLDALSSSD